MRLLLIQSHVVHGYVGNRAATFPLQLRGWDVDALNTTQFLNHPGYGRFAGTRTLALEAEAILRGLAAIDCHYECVLTGYTPDAATLTAVADWVGARCAADRCVWVVDPVLGDNGRLYVHESLVPAYQAVLLSGHVALATPNQFELGVLVGCPVDLMADVRTALERFHEQFPVPHVVVTSVQFGADTDMVCVALLKGQPPAVFDIPRIDAHFSGAGDLFTAIATDVFYQHRHEPSAATSAAATATALVLQVLQISYEHADKPEGAPVVVHDLSLIQARHLLPASPTQLWHAL